MRICIVSYTPPYMTPYINCYLMQIQKAGACCDIVFWDRDGSRQPEEREGVRYFPYAGSVLQSQSKLTRYLRYVPATLHIRSHLCRGDYDRVVFLQTHAAIACMDILFRKYRKKYIVDIRDFTLEQFGVFRSAERKVIDASYAAVISSRGYRAFLPPHAYVIAHNYTAAEEHIAAAIRHRRRDGACIRIALIGCVRFYDMAEKMLLLLKNDPRYHLSFIGTGAAALDVFCRKNNILNVTLHDYFEPERTAEFYASCDLINNLYGNHKRCLDYALSNKLYYAAQFQIPVLVSTDTYSGKIAQKYGLGFTWNPDGEAAADVLYHRVRSFEHEQTEELRKEFLDRVRRENLQFERMLADFVKD